MEQKAQGETTDLLSQHQPGDASEGYEDICRRFIAGVQAETAILPDDLRATIEVTAACTNRDWDRLKELAAASPGNGLSAEELAEICLQTAIYSGMAQFTRALAAIRAGLEDTGRSLSFTPSPDGDTDKLAYDLRKSLHSDRYAKGHADESSYFSGQLYRIISRIGYGEVWSRPQLSLRLRLCCALAGLAMSGPPEVLCKFARTALENGWNRELLRAALVETVLYNGGPRTLFALMAVEDSLQSET